MPQSLANVLVHIIFSTKDRRPFLRGGICQDLHPYLAEVSERLGCPTLAVGGIADHVHILGRMSRSISLSDWVKETKRVSSIWLKRRQTLSKFSWQEGYGAFSVSASQASTLQRYIADQVAHHKKLSFQDELRAILQKTKTDYDERYIWD